MFAPEPLRGGFSDYAPYISDEIMELHYSKHYLSYLKNLNTALEKYPEFFKLEISQILSRLQEIPESIRETVRNNGGGAINHEIFWKTIDTKETTIHEGQLKSDIVNSFGSWEKFCEKFWAEGAKRFGSGWIWLVVGPNKELSIYSTPNQDSPYMNGDYPVFGIDVWEHAYYLQYKNLRGNYIKELWKILDWKEIERRYLSIC